MASNTTVSQYHGFLMLQHPNMTLLFIYKILDFYCVCMKVKLFMAQFTYVNCCDTKICVSWLFTTLVLRFLGLLFTQKDFGFLLFVHEREVFLMDS